MKATVNSTLAIGLIAVVMIISMEKMNESKLEAAFDLGTENGKQIAQLGGMRVAVQRCVKQLKKSRGIAHELLRCMG